MADEKICTREGCNFKTDDLEKEECPICQGLLFQVSTEEQKWLGKLIDTKYRIIRLIGRGGMGTVYEAEQQPLERRVAIKFLRAGTDARAVKMFLKEAKAASQLNHPNIITVHDFGQASTNGFDQLFLVMELLAGGHDLASELAKEKSGLELNRLQKIVSQICDALLHAHEHGVIHRDLKPENIIIVNQNGGERVKVLDFGIAKILGSKTQTQGISGTPYYMSPEQIKGEPVDGRADLYSLACLLYECLTGRLLYDGETLIDIFMKHTSGKFQNVTKLRPELPPEVDDFFTKALAVDRNKRFADAAEFKKYFLSLAGPQNAVTRRFEEVKLPDRGSAARYAFYFVIAVMIIFAIYLYFSQSETVAKRSVGLDVVAAESRTVLLDEPDAKSENVLMTDTMSAAEATAATALETLEISGTKMDETEIKISEEIVEAIEDVLIDAGLALTEILSDTKDPAEFPASETTEEKSESSSSPTKEKIKKKKKKRNGFEIKIY